MLILKLVINYVPYVESIYSKSNNRFEKIYFANNEIYTKEDTTLPSLY